MQKNCEPKDANCTWPEVGYHVLEELKAISRRVDKLESSIAKVSLDIGKIHAQLAGLKVKSSMWGLIGGAISVAIMLAAAFLTSRH